MLGCLLKATVGVIVLGLAGYTVVAVPVGRRTLFEHALAIARTDPAQELGHELHTAAADALARVRQAIARH